MQAVDVSLSSTGLVWLLNGQLRENEPARDVPLTQLPFRMGRRPDLGLALESPAVSTLHAEIIGDLAAELMIQDLGSTNGTYVNGIQITQPEPVHEGDWIQLANIVFRLHCQHDVVSAKTQMGERCDAALALMQFDRLLDQRAVIPFFQPLLRLADKHIVGFESLARSQMFGTQTPAAMFQAASQLNLEAELSRLCRHVSLEQSRHIGPSLNLFLNTHPAELCDQSALSRSLEDLRAEFPDQRLTLEIHEKSVAETAAMLELCALLTSLDIELAYDDFGAGQARLVQLTEVPPHYLKFDIGLIHAIDKAPKRRHDLLESLVRMVRDLAIIPLAEGVETEAEAAVCQQLGFQMGQGFYYGNPMAPQHLENAFAIEAVENPA